MLVLLHQADIWAHRQLVDLTGSFALVPTTRYFRAGIALSAAWAFICVFVSALNFPSPRNVYFLVDYVDDKVQWQLLYSIDGIRWRVVGKIFKSENGFHYILNGDQSDKSVYYKKNLADEWDKILSKYDFHGLSTATIVTHVIDTALWIAVFLPIIFAFCYLAAWARLTPTTNIKSQSGVPKNAAAKSLLSIIWSFAIRILKCRSTATSEAGADPDDRTERTARRFPQVGLIKRLVVAGGLVLVVGLCGYGWTLREAGAQLSNSGGNIAAVSTRTYKPSPSKSSTVDIERDWQAEYLAVGKPARLSSRSPEFKWSGAPAPANAGTSIMTVDRDFAAELDALDDPAQMIVDSSQFKWGSTFETPKLGNSETTRKMQEGGAFGGPAHRKKEADTNIFDAQDKPNTTTDHSKLARPTPETSTTGEQQRAQETWSRITLPQGVSFELPSNWVVMSEQQRLSVEAAVQAMAKWTVKGNAGLGATLYSPQGTILAQANFRFFSGNASDQITQLYIKQAPQSELDSIEESLKKGTVEAAEKLGASISAWQPSRRVESGEFIAILSEYTSRYAHEGIIRRHLRLRVFDGSQSFSLLLRYDERRSAALRPMLDQIANSLARTPSVK